jgi:hypothetical protein
MNEKLARIVSGAAGLLIGAILMLVFILVDEERVQGR